jgi:hypothetical protein
LTGQKWSAGVAVPFLGTSQTTEVLSVKKKPTPAEIVIMASGAVALIFSFFKFYGAGDFGTSAWGSGLFPTATLMAIFAAAMAVVVALGVFGVSLPDRIVGFTWNQIHLVLGFFAALYAVAYLVVNTGLADKKVGFWGVLIGCLGALAGAIMLQREGSTSGAPPSAPPAA